MLYFWVVKVIDLVIFFYIHIQESFKLILYNQSRNYCSVLITFKRKKLRKINRRI